MKTYVQPGHVLTVSAPADTKSGDFVVIGSIFGTATSNALNGTDLELALGGVYDAQPKVPAQAWTQGQALYWDSVAKNFTTTVATNLKVGVAALPAANPSNTGRIRFNGSF